MNNQIEWRRAFIRSGFNPREENGSFDFGHENQGIQEFLGLILEKLGQSDVYKYGVFSPTSTTTDESVWLAVVKGLHTGSEGGNPEMDRFEINIMDTYMAGIVRWVNAAGIETTFSCDGHGYQKAEMNLRQRHQELCLNYFLQCVSNGQWRFRNRCFLKGDERPNTNRRVGWRQLALTNAPDYDRSWLLDVAEKIHLHQNLLRQLVEISDELARE